MKTRAKIGNKKGNPAYRTPSPFKYQKAIIVFKNEVVPAASGRSTCLPAGRFERLPINQHANRKEKAVPSPDKSSRFAYGFSEPACPVGRDDNYE